jgi:hypothetical protein
MTIRLQKIGSYAESVGKNRGKEPSNKRDFQGMALVSNGR